MNNNYGVRSNAAVRKVLAESDKVLAVFQGHSHQNDLKLIDGFITARWLPWSRDPERQTKATR